MNLIKTICCAPVIVALAAMAHAQLYPSYRSPLYRSYPPDYRMRPQTTPPGTPPPRPGTASREGTTPIAPTSESQRGAGGAVTITGAITRPTVISSSGAFTLGS